MLGKYDRFSTLSCLHSRALGPNIAFQFPRKDERGESMRERVTYSNRGGREASFKRVLPRALEGKRVAARNFSKRLVVHVVSC